MQSPTWHKTQVSHVGHTPNEKCEPPGVTSFLAHFSLLEQKPHCFLEVVVTMVLGLSV